MTATIIRGDALAIPLKSNSVNMAIFSPPYFGLRSYQDAGEHYEGQIGSEPHPQDYLEALWAVMAEVWRVLTDDGVVVCNLGDKRNGSGSYNNATLTGAGGNGGLQGAPQRERIGRARQMPRVYSKAGFGRRKSKMLLPHRFAIGCEDGLADPEGLGWVMIQDVVWRKGNSIPESVGDRPRDIHEYWFMFAKAVGTRERWYSAMDEIREEPLDVPRMLTRNASAGKAHREGKVLKGTGMGSQTFALEQALHPAGALPGSVRTVNAEPLGLPDYFVEDENGWRVVFRGKASKSKPMGGLLNGDGPAPSVVYPGLVKLWQYAQRRYEQGATYLRLHDIDHYAAFPSKWPEWFILGWTPPGICTVCDKGRWPVVDKRLEVDDRGNVMGKGSKFDGCRELGVRSFVDSVTEVYGSTRAQILGYACDCTPYTDHPGTPRNKGRTTWKAGQVGLEGVHDDAGRRFPREGVAWREYHLDRWDPSATRPAVVLDPFGGTGTTAMVADALGRIGISLDLSFDYCRLAEWRVNDTAQRGRVIERVQKDRQVSLL